MQKNLLNLQNPRENIKSFFLLENAKGTKILNYYATFKTQENQRFSANDFHVFNKLTTLKFLTVSAS